MGVVGHEIPQSQWYLRPQHFILGWTLRVLKPGTSGNPHYGPFGGRCLGQLPHLEGQKDLGSRLLTGVTTGSYYMGHRGYEPTY